MLHLRRTKPSGASSALEPTRSREMFLSSLTKTTSSQSKPRQIPFASQKRSKIRVTSEPGSSTPAKQTHWNSSQKVLIFFHGRSLPKVAHQPQAAGSWMPSLGYLSGRSGARPADRTTPTFCRRKLGVPKKTYRTTVSLAFSSPPKKKKNTRVSQDFKAMKMPCHLCPLPLHARSRPALDSIRDLAKKKKVGRLK